MKSIYTNKIHNNPHSHQKIATKTYKAFNGLKIFLPDGANASKKNSVLFSRL